MLSITSDGRKDGVMYACRDYLLGVFEMLVVTMIWGSITLFAIWSGLPSPVFVFFRVLVAVPAIAAMIIVGKGVGALKVSGNKKYVIVSGVLLTLNWVFLFYAVQFTAIANAVMLYYTGPVVAIVLSPVALKEKVPAWVVIPVFMTVSGIFLMVLQGFSSLTIPGFIFGILSGVAYGGLAVTSKLAAKEHEPEVVVLYQAVISLFLLFPFAVLWNYSMNEIVALIVVVVGVVHTALALRIWYDALTRIPMRTASVLSYLDPVFATIFAYIFLAQIPSMYTIVGGMMIIVAGLMIVLKVE